MKFKIIGHGDNKGRKKEFIKYVIVVVIVNFVPLCEEWFFFITVSQVIDFRPLNLF